MSWQFWKPKLATFGRRFTSVGQPIAATVAAISGGFLTYDFESLAKRIPTWEGPVRWLQAANPAVFIFSVILSLILSGFIAFRAVKREKEIGKLEGELQTARRQADEVSNVVVILFDGLLLNLANRLKLTQDAQARLSLYVHDPEVNSFVPCGRYSRNPDYARPGRTHYPDNQGCIAHGWRNDWHFDAQIPPANQPARRATYNLRTYGVPEAVTNATRMKSTLYAVKCVRNREEKAIAVVVFEAMSGVDYDEMELRAEIEAVAGDYARVIQELRAFVPNPANAAESGL